MPSKTLKSHQIDRLLGMTRRARSSVTTHTCLEAQNCKMLPFLSLITLLRTNFDFKNKLWSRVKDITGIAISNNFNLDMNDVLPRTLKMLKIHTTKPCNFNYWVNKLNNAVIKFSSEHFKINRWSIPVNDKSARSMDLKNGLKFENFKVAF